MENPIHPTGGTPHRLTAEDPTRPTAPTPQLPPYLKGPVEFLLKTLLPVVLTASVGYFEAQAKKAELFDLLENYREYILEVEGQIPPCPEEER